MKNEYLTFEKCLLHLEYSFLRVKDAYFGKQVDFQHPSLRDMLLNSLQNKPQVKRQYILNASPSALSSIIEGVSMYNQTSEEEPHVLILNNEKELSLLLQRINAVITDTVPYEGLREILIGTDTLIPQKNNEKIAPADLDLVKFSKTAQGKVVKTVLTAFGKQDTYDNNTQYLFFLWIDLLHKFYQLASYIIPIPRLEYIDMLTSRLKEGKIDDKIKFVSLLSLHEPLQFKQVSNSRLEKLCNEYIHKQLQERIKQCKLEDWNEWDPYEDYDDAYSAYDDWQSGSRELVILSDEFYSSMHLKPPKEISKLRSLIESAWPPSEPEREDIESSDYDYYERYEYWTIERVFEDL